MQNQRALVPNLRMVVLGDSVPWGQGLQTSEKFYSLVKVALSGSDCAQSCAVLAHSGAIIGAGATTTGPILGGEVPTAYPTILQQCANVTDPPETVDLVLLNGGINDINVRTILNPLTDSSHLQDRIVQHCHRDMKTLLDAVLKKFTKPTCRFVVTGYFLILSAQSDRLLMNQFLKMHGLSFASLVDLFSLINLTTDDLFQKILNNCALFFRQSSQSLQQAVDETNQAVGGAPRVFFAQPPFTEANAALAPQAWLWGLKPILRPEDPVQDDRRAACLRDEHDLLRLPTCFLASAGHPNLTGAQQFAAAILAALS